MTEQNKHSEKEEGEEPYIIDEYSQSWDPEIKQFFRKIMNSFGVGAFWLLLFGISGLFFRLALVEGEWRWYNVLFYGVFVLSLLLLILFFYRTWGKKK